MLHRTTIALRSFGIDVSLTWNSAHIAKFPRVYAVSTGRSP